MATTKPLSPGRPGVGSIVAGNNQSGKTHILPGGGASQRLPPVTASSDEPIAAVDISDAVIDFIANLDEAATAIDAGDADTSPAGTTINVSLYEPIYPGVTADSTAVTADSTIYTADGGALEGATDAVDADVIAAGAAIIVETAEAADVLDADIV